jgi:serine protease inhibitor
MKKIYILSTLSLLLCFSVSCKKDKSAKGGKDLQLTNEEQQKVATDNNFAFNLLKAVTVNENADKNIMISPFSVGVALSMVSNGSQGATLEAIHKTLRSEGLSEDIINDYYSKIIKDLPLLDPTTDINIANSIWYRQGFTPTPTFLKTNEDKFNARSEALNFQDPAAKNIINNWVNTQTKGKIPTIIEEIPQGMVMYLINAVYFKGTWKYTFDKSKTTTGTFNLGNGQTVPTPFMSEKMKLNMAITPSATAYELLYGNGKYSMVIVVPASTTTLNDYIASMTDEKWLALSNSLREAEIIIRLPKFKFSYEKELKSTLTNLGMGIAFGDQADFKRINPQGNLLISEVKHKTFIDVNEEGTEAAAVTSVGVGPTSGPMQYLVNRPFLFAIREVNSGLILFNGLIRNPTAN